MCSIIEISKSEAQQIIKEFCLSPKRAKWGGLFVYEIPPDVNHGKTTFGTIDDSDGQCHVAEFKKREQALEWLKNPKGPKTCRV